MVAVFLYLRIMQDDFSILVNTTDSFSDCWEPFFRLFKFYWPNYSGKIYLNTETKNFIFEDLNIISIKNNIKDKSWSKCLFYAVNMIEEDTFIYMQEDYFLKDMVNDKKIKELYRKYKKYDLDCLHLTDQCTSGPFKEFKKDEDLLIIHEKAPYRISTQAAFWKKNTILKVLRPWESGWDFEKFGTKRSIKETFKIFAVNNKTYIKNHSEIIPYIFTGIIKGKWKKEVVSLFKKHNIKVNFDNRGFVDLEQHSSFTNKINTFRKLMLSYIKNYYESIKLYIETNK